jgi:hypothetical protein
MVFTLPVDVLAAILSSWIDIQALTWLDSALCASKSRKQFKQLVGDELFVAATMCTCSTMTREMYVKHLEWLTNRKIKVRNWIVNWDVTETCPPHLMRCTAGPHVRTLHLRGLSQSGMTKVFDTLVITCCGLQILKIDCCQQWEIVSTLSASAQLTLQELTIACCNGYRWESKAQFPNLWKLHVKHVIGVEVVQSLTSLLIAAPNLTDLRRWSSTQCPINDKSLQVLSNHAAKLETLELDIQHQDFTPAIMTALGQRCHNLKTLALTCGDGIDDAAVEAFALHCSRLEGLQLRGEFAAASFFAVATHCGSRLRYLTLDTAQCEPAVLTSLAGNCRLLEELKLCNCGSLASDSLVGLVSSLPRLRELVLENTFYSVTDEVLIAIATHLPKLDTLGLYCCGNGYTEIGALALVTSLTQLRRFCIDTSDIVVFTSTLRKRWQEVSPGLQIYDNAVQTRYFKRL